MNELSIADITQQYHKNIVRFRGMLVYVTRVFADRRIKMTKLMDGTEICHPFNQEDFTTTKARLGMVNIFDSAVYTSRIPIRRYGMGINSSNIEVNMLDVKYPRGVRETSQMIQLLGIPEIGRTLSNIYPTFAEAVSRVTMEPDSTVAFDRQFAISTGGAIIYKTKNVGYLPFGGTKTAEIVFSRGCEHLSILLESNYEQTVRTPCP